MSTTDPTIRSRPSVARALLLALTLLLTGNVFAQHGHGHDHDHDDIEFPEPTNFVEAAEQALEIAGHLRADLESRSFDHLHDDSIVLARVARMLGRLALVGDSGVARPHVREINIAGRELAMIADRLHDAADSRNETACRRHLEAMTDHLAVIETNLKRVTDRTYTATMTLARSPVPAGQDVALQIAIRDDRDRPITSFDVVHEQRLHLIVVSDDLDWFAHHHPSLDDQGHFELTMQFPAGGRYRLFHDFKPAGMPAAIAKADLTVEGERRERRTLEPNVERPQRLGEYEVESHGHRTIHAGREGALWFIVRHRGEPVEHFQPYLGERGHLVAISRDLAHYVHAHPAGHDHDHDHQHHDHGHDQHDHGHHAGALGFHVKFPEPGLYRMWVEFKHHDKVHVAAFTVNVEPASAHDSDDMDDMHDEHDDHEQTHGDDHGHRH